MQPDEIDPLAIVCDSELLDRNRFRRVQRRQSEDQREHFSDEPWVTLFDFFSTLDQKAIDAYLAEKRRNAVKNDHPTFLACARSGDSSWLYARRHGDESLMIWDVTVEFRSKPDDLEYLVKMHSEQSSDSMQSVGVRQR
jgi:hypothetical protein